VRLLSTATFIFSKIDSTIFTKIETNEIQNTGKIRIRSDNYREHKFWQQISTNNLPVSVIFWKKSSEDLYTEKASV
jgi:hypothetical protein